MNLNAKLKLMELERQNDELKRRAGVEDPTPAELEDMSPLGTQKMNVERRMLQYLHRVMSAKSERELLNIINELKYGALAVDWIEPETLKED